MDREFANLAWCFALPFVAIRAYDGWRSVERGARVPILWGLDGRPTWRAPRSIAFGVPPLAAVLAWTLLIFIPERHDALTLAMNLGAAATFVAVSFWFVRRAVRDAA